MSASVLNRMFVVAALVGAVSLVGTSVPTSAQQDKQKGPKQHEQKQKQEKKQKEAQPQKPGHEQRAQPQERARPQQQARPEQQARPDQQARPQPQARPQAQVRQQAQRQSQQVQGRLPQQQQDQLIGQQQQRLVQYRDQMVQQQRQAPQQAVELQRQNRTAQYGFQQQYVAGLREQQLGIQSAGNYYNYGGDPYFYTPPVYRYSRGGHYYETNEYGAGALRQAINSGYEIGFGAGRADRMDHWAYNYRGSYAYQDGIYGYRGFYIERAEYNYYFRQGFRRGYEDGYYGRHRYGVYATGRSGVLNNVLSVILNFRSIR